MNQLWIVVGVLVAVLVLTRIRGRRRLAATQRPESGGPRIFGDQVVAFVHPAMSAACLYDHGMQFGRGFRRKEGPQLPHDAACRCQTVPFSYSSSEVFNGALRGLPNLRSSVAGLDAAGVARLIERLRAVEAQPLAANAGDYGEAVGVSEFEAALQPALTEFLNERHAHLMQNPSQHPAGSDDAEAGEPLNADSIGTANTR